MITIESVQQIEMFEDEGSRFKTRVTLSTPAKDGISKDVYVFETPGKHSTEDIKKMFKLIG